MTVELTFEKFQLFRSVLLQGANCNTRRHIVTHCNTLQHTPTLCNTRQHTVMHCNTLQHTATHCNTLQHTATHGDTSLRTATHCNTLQHTATHCNTRQHTVMHCNTLQHSADLANDLGNMLNRCLKPLQKHNGELLPSYATPADHPLRLLAAGLFSRLFLCVHTATHCNTLLHTATHCNTLQHTRLRRTTRCACLPKVCVGLDSILFFFFSCM